MNQCNTVVLTGEFRKQPAQAIFTRSPKEGWTLEINVAEITAMHVLGKSCKPCWTVACEFFAKLSPPKTRKRHADWSETTETFTRKREIESRTAGYFRVINRE